jgi:hypothetical protein
MKKILLLMLLLLVQFGCAAIEHRKLDTQVKLQQTVFINPDALDGRPIYLRVTNQTGKPDINFDALVAQKLTAKGYTVTKNSREAGVRLLVNFVYLDQAKEHMTKDTALAGGFGGAIIGGLATQTWGGAAAGAAGGAVLGSLVGLMFPIDTWYGIVDVQIEEPLQQAALRRTSSATNQQLGSASGEGHSSTRGTASSAGSQGTRESSELEYVETVNHKKTQTRIVAEAKQTNIDAVEASKQIREQLAESIANFL